MKRLMLGNEAVARGLYEAGVRVVSSYPGTPSTEITEYAAKYDEMYCGVGAKRKGCGRGCSRCIVWRRTVFLRHEARWLECGGRPGIHHVLYWCQPVVW